MTHESTRAPAALDNIEKFARALVATYDDPHLSAVAVERAMGMLRRALEPQPVQQHSGNTDSTGREAIAALELAAVFIENIKPEELELWRASKVAEIRRDICHFAAREPAPVARDLPPLPEMLSLADIPAAQATPESWDADYRETWQKLQVADCNRRQWRAYALELRAALDVKAVARELDADTERRAFEAWFGSLPTNADPHYIDAWMESARRARATAESAPASAAPDELPHLIVMPGRQVGRTHALAQQIIDNMTDEAKARTSYGNIRDVLDAVHKLSRAPSNSSPVGAEESK